MDQQRTHCQCDGWWEQDGLGRQPMSGLTLSFHGREVSGAGLDVIGRFTFAGQWREDGQVVLRKQYIGKHAVDYYGTYDGEGTLSGTWDVGLDRGPWLITIRAGRGDANAAISDLAEKR